MYHSWHRTQSISVTSVSYEELREQYLQFSVYDFDRFSRNDLIGQVVLKELLDCTDLEQEIEYTMDILCAMQVTNVSQRILSNCDTIEIPPSNSSMRFLGIFQFNSLKLREIISEIRIESRTLCFNIEKFI